MKKLISIILLLSLAFSLAACGHEHTWQEATCTQPKTCAECGETEGEALGHDPTEATMWEPSVCSRCGEVMGEALVPDFEAHGISVKDIADVPTEFFNGGHMEDMGDGSYRYPSSDMSYVTGPTDLDSISKAPWFYSNYDAAYEDYQNWDVYINVRLVDYSIIESDEEHQGLEGYEWRIATFDQCIINDFMGWQLAVSDEDYYYIEDHDDSALGPYYTVNWQGETYDQCIRTITFGEIGSYTVPGEGRSSSECQTHPVTFAFRVPVGYDGTVVCFRDSGVEFNKGQYIYDVKQPMDLFIRLT